MHFPLDDDIPPNHFSYMLLRAVTQRGDDNCEYVRPSHYLTVLVTPLDLQLLSPGAGAWEMKSTKQAVLTAKSKSGNKKQVRISC